MSTMICKPVFRKSSSLSPSATKRKGVRERRLLTQGECSYQNIVLIDIDAGAEVELHPYPTSETIYVLQGEIEILLPESTECIESGDLYHFPPGATHGLRCLKGPGQFLIIFAPPRGTVS